MIDVNLDYGEIGLLIHADELGIMARRAIWLTLQLDANAICLLDHVAIGDDIALRIDNYAGAERALADVAGVRAALAAEKLIEEILEWAIVSLSLIALVILIGIRPGRPAAATVRILDGGLGIDVDDTRLQLLRNLRER